MRTCPIVDEISSASAPSPDLLTRVRKSTSPPRGEVKRLRRAAPAHDPSARIRFGFSCQTARVSHRGFASRVERSPRAMRKTKTANAAPPGGRGAPGVALPSFLPSHSEGSGAPSGAPCRVRAAARPGEDQTARRGTHPKVRRASRRSTGGDFCPRAALQSGTIAAHRACPPLAGSLQADRYYPPGGAPGPPGPELARFQRERRTSLRLRTASRRRPSMSEATIIVSAVFPTGITFFAAAASRAISR